MGDGHYALIIWTMATLIFGSLVWRVTCHYVTVPWPYWLAWWLENPYMRLFANPHTLVRRLRLEPGMRVLDVGCGAGRVAIPMARQVGPEGHVTAVDSQAGMIRLIRTKVTRLGLTNISIQHTSLNQLSRPASGYDRIVMITVLGEIPDREAAMGHLATLLARHGELVVMEVLPDPCYLPRALVSRWARAAGLIPRRLFRNGLAYTAVFSK